VKINQAVDSALKSKKREGWGGMTIGRSVEQQSVCVPILMDPWR
jgi:hypothetical protein